MLKQQYIIGDKTNFTMGMWRKRPSKKVIWESLVNVSLDAWEIIWDFSKVVVNVREIIKMWSIHVL